ncbi:glucokinase [Novosphingobium sp. 9U]|uniref:glucokinase n=1 Tax=Novosphingobium sp. 9U TaxID=2653158 RepID=UPI0012EFF503|nr:glucokinase [Novosphingobium sp. 9U]VWX54803.1 Glucokinase [Novosphingobium sp. 9U]
MTDIVSVDIGGTHARFAIASVAPNGAITLGEPDTLHTKDYASFQTAWEAFRDQHGGTLPRAIAMSIAGPVGGEVIRFTNNPWIIRPALVPEKLHVDRFTIVNDFAAVAHAVARADEAHLEHLAGPVAPLPQTGALTVVGPGTGLGVAILLRESDRYMVQATEGGHIDFAPKDTIEDAILAHLRQQHPRVSVERVVSGPAIVDIYRALAAMERRAVTEHSDVELWTAGTDGSDSLAAAAVDRFCMALGSAAGDYALAHGAVGVVVAGGLGYRIRDTLVASAFAERFAAKGRFAHLMASLPVKLITHPQPGLFGAAAAFAREHLS